MFQYGGVAQLGERLVCNQNVAGSIPVTSTKVFNKENTMTCRGYDSKAVKVPKSVKILASSYINAHQRGGLIRSYVQILEDQTRSFKKEKQ